MRKSFKMGVLATLLTLTAFTTSCYGPFTLTRDFYHWNGSFENKWGREAVYFFLSPVYGITALCDALVFNSVVFWGGEPWIKPSAMAEPSKELDSVAAVYGLNCTVGNTVVHPTR